jgi:hypothetical protein
MKYLIYYPHHPSWLGCGGWVLDLSEACRFSRHTAFYTYDPTFDIILSEDEAAVVDILNK